VGSRWLRWAGPGLIVLVYVGMVASAAGAGQRPWSPRACSDGTGNAAAAARSSEPVGLGDMRQVPWYRLDARLDRSGALVGQRLGLGIDGGRSSRFIDLPPESFAAGPFGRMILVGADDGATSRIEAVDPAAECSWTLAHETDVIRRATIDPAGVLVYEMRVDRTSRTDLGIWAQPLDGSRGAIRVLEPIGFDDRFGPTFSTEFAWDLANESLAIQSCGELACRTRILGQDGNSLHAVDEPDLGTMVGIADNVLVSYGACPGLPCQIVATDITSGVRSVIADAAAGAALTATPDGPRLVHEVFADGGVAVWAVALDGSSASSLGSLPDGLRLHPAAGMADAGTLAPSGWVVLSPDGRVPSGGPDGLAQLRHVPDGTTVALEEVTR
jgi:hypothetical protein